MAVAYGMRDNRRGPATLVSSAGPTQGSPATSPATLEPLEAGLPIPADRPPRGWTHLVSKSIPKLETGDLDTVSQQAHVIASRVRPVIAAELESADGEPGSRWRLVRVGMGLCAPAAAEGEDVVVTASKVEGTRGGWTTKERLILTAMAYETSKATLVAATPTFALVKTPVNSLVGGSHRKLDSYHAILVDPRTGALRTLVWQVPDDAGSARPGSATIPARLMDAPVFSCPMDVHATKLPGNIPVAWSFAIRGLPPGIDIAIPASLMESLGRPDPDGTAASRLEYGLAALLP
ncbi:hypothetical protein [Aquisphaera giovannonii]|nr:hypothetical protein [Aquisphaera giovannonii]